MKKASLISVVAYILALCMVLGAVGVTVAAADEYVIGDITMDGAVDLRDAQRLFQHSMMPSLYPIAYTGNVDFTYDGIVDIMDSLYLFRYSMMPDKYPIK